MRFCSFVMLLLPLAALADARPLHPNDFAYGMTLQGDGAGALYSFGLPDEVYRHAVRSDLGDMRIFNSKSEVVPHLLQHTMVREETRHTETLPVFPVFEDEVDGKSETVLRIEPGQHGAVIDLRTQSGWDSVDKTISYYIIDASALDQPIRRVALHWPMINDSFVSTVVVEQSSDLSNWRPLASATLADLKHGDDWLQRNEIVLPYVQQPYLRINWPLGSKGIALTSVEAEVAQPGPVVAFTWNGATNLASDGSSGSYIFEVSGYYPAERLQLVLPQDNTMVRATLSSSTDPENGPWTKRYQGLLYSLVHEGKRLESGELTITPTNDRYWRLEVSLEGGGIGEGLPQLKVGWHPHQAIFVARGASPFTLAFGSARVANDPPDQGLTSWLAAQRTGTDRIVMKDAVPQAMHLLGGEQQLQPAPPPVPWKKWLLWAVLVAGVLAMLGMARSLYRQMNQGGSASIL